MSADIASLGPAVITSVGTARPALPGERSQRRDPAPAPLPQTHASARQMVESEGPYRIRIDSQTLRVITEVVDTASGDVLFYLPPGYRPGGTKDPIPSDNGDAGGGQS